MNQHQPMMEIDSIVTTVLKGIEETIGTPTGTPQIETRWLRQVSKAYVELKNENSRIEVELNRVRFTAQEELRKTELAVRELETRASYMQERMADALKRASDSDERAKTLLAGMADAEARATDAMNARNKAETESRDLQTAAKLLAGHTHALQPHVERLHRALKETKP